MIVDDSEPFPLVVDVWIAGPSPEDVSMSAQKKE
jgi:hypothetical protein